MSATKKKTTKATTSLRPLADRVVVRPLEDTEQKKGGLFIPDTAKEKPQQGEVIAVGPGAMEEGKRIPVEVEVGQKVLFGKYSGTEVTIDDNKLLIIKQSDVLAVIG